MNRSIVWTLAGLALALPVAAQDQPVGTFHKKSIVVAYYRSDAWKKAVDQKREEQKAARAAGDQAKVAELEKWGAGSQELAHRQLEGKAPIDSVVEALRPVLTEVAARHGAAGIAADPPKGVRTVDLTTQILDAMGADEKTRKVIEELRKLEK